MTASPTRQRGTGTIQEKTIYEVSEFLDEKLNRITTYWKNLKANYVHFSSSITLAYSLSTSPRGLDGNFSEVTSLEDVMKCYDAVKNRQFTESAFVISTFLHTVTEIKQLYQEVERYRPTLVASQDSNKARYVREFCVELENWRKMVEGCLVAKTVHPEVLSLTNDGDIQKRTGRVFSVIPVMLDHANSLIRIMKKGWPPRLDTVLQRPRTAYMLTSPRMSRSASMTSMQPLLLSGKSAKTEWRPADAVVGGQTATETLRKSKSTLGLPSLETGAAGSGKRGSSVCDIDDEAPLSRCSSPWSTSSAYETGPNSLSRVTITNSNVTISSGSEADSSQWSPIDSCKHPIVKEITEVLQSKFDQELDKATTRLEKKITDATDTLREDIQHDLKKRDKRIDNIKSDVDQLSKFVDEKFSDLDTELLKLDVFLKDYIKPLDDEQIQVIGQNIGPHVYPKMARALGISQTQMEWIKEKHKDDEQEVVIASLHKWRKASDKRKATLETVIRALVNNNERQTANQILRAFKEE